tara:strand:+ start:520 stop:669 length:150 start_codon:yes stop_codon:yes gene_type:complete
MGVNNMWKKEFELELADVKLRLEKLEKNSHPPREFVKCSECNCEIKEIK